jgi:hypothetical protein
MTGPHSSPQWSIAPVMGRLTNISLRGSIALPICAVALLLDYVGDAFGRLVAWISGDDWPGNEKRGAAGLRQKTVRTWLMDQQRCRIKLGQLTTGTLAMTEYVITEVSLHQWLVFADRKCIASCADEVGAEKAMREHSARGRRSPEPVSIGPTPAAAPQGQPFPNEKTGG